MYKRHSERCEDVTPEMALTLLAINFKGQRPLNPRKVSSYVELADAGRMRTISVDIAILPDGSKALVNGQHTLNMIVSRGKRHHAIITNWRCDTDEDVWRLFGSFDTHPPRTQRHIMMAARGLLTDSKLREVDCNVLAAVGSALFIIGDGTGEPQWQTCEDKSVKVSLVDQHPEEVRFIDGLKDNSTRHLMRIGVIAAMIATWRISKSAALTFWRKVLYSENLSKGEPEWQLSRALERASHSSRGRNGQKYDYANSICWWNAWRDPEQKRKTVKVAAMIKSPKPS